MKYEKIEVKSSQEVKSRRQEWIEELKNWRSQEMNEELKKPRIKEMKKPRMNEVKSRSQEWRIEEAKNEWRMKKPRMN